MSNNRTEVLVPEYLIKFWIAQLAQQIAENYRSAVQAARAFSFPAEGEERIQKDGDLILITVLTGGVVFACELLQALNNIGIDARLETLKASSYGNGKMSSGNVVITPTFELSEVQGNHVVVVEDLIDLGLTLHTLIKELEQYVPASILLAVMCQKIGMQKYPIDVKTHVGFETPPSWIQGHGIDTAGFGRGGSDLIAVVNSDEEAAAVRAFRKNLEQTYAQQYPSVSALKAAVATMKALTSSVPSLETRVTTA